MTCTQFEAMLHPYVDGELSPEAMWAANGHLAACAACSVLAERAREFHGLVRWQPREASPPELRARIVGLTRRDRRQRAWRPSVLVPALLTVAAALGAGAVLVARQSAAPLLAELVDKHIAYTQIEHPVEFASGDHDEVERWFRQRAGLRITAPDFSRESVHLVGARLAEARGRQAAYLLYERGRTWLSVFIVPGSRDDTDAARRAPTSEGQRYVAKELKGFQTVSWRTEGVVFALVSALDGEALLQCAERLRLEREYQNRL